MSDPIIVSLCPTCFTTKTFDDDINTPISCDNCGEIVYKHYLCPICYDRLHSHCECLNHMNQHSHWHQIA